MVGRARERGVMIERLEALQQESRSGVVVIEGEAGIGKSRLVEDLRREAEVRGIQCLMGEADAIETGSPYYAWRPIVSRLFDLDQLPEESPEGIRHRRDHVLRRLTAHPDLAHLAPLLNPILPLDLPENEFTREMTGEVRADNTRDLLLRLLQAATSRNPTLIILEDAHWLDSASWSLALAARRQVGPLLLVLATRPMLEPLPVSYSQLLTDPTTERLELEALPVADAMALVCQRLGVSSLPSQVQALIQEKAQGHPFFSEELAYALRDAGLLVIEQGVCRLSAEAGDLQAFAFPDTLQGVITSRIDRLSPSQQLMLKVASVIGRVFAFRILRDVHPIEADKGTMSSQLAALERLDLTPLEAPEPELSYIFKHVITQEVAYSLMLFAQRRQLHHAVAEWYERYRAKDLARLYPVLAHHWSRAEVAEKAIEYLAMAGEEALRGGAYQEARRFFWDVLSLGTQADRLTRAHWERQLGEACNGLGHLAEAREHLERSVALLGWPPPPAGVRLLASTISQAGLQLWHSIRRTRLKMRSPTAENETIEAAAAYERLGQIYYFANDMLRTGHACLLTTNLAEISGSPSHLARGYANLCIGLSVIPIHPLARMYRRRAIEIARRLDRPLDLAWVLEIRGLYDMGVGSWDECRRALEEAVAICDRLGDRRHWAESQALLAAVLFYQGELAESDRMGLRLEEEGQHADGHMQGNGLLAQIRAAWMPQGKLADTIHAAETVLGLYPDEMDPGSKVWAQALVALAHLRLGSLEPARQAAEQTMNLIARFNPTAFWTIEGYGLLAEVYLSLWEREVSSPSGGQQYARPAQDACSRLRSFARVFPAAKPYAMRWYGLYHWLAGRPSRAFVYWRKSLASAEQMGIPYQCALAHYEMGRHQSGTERQEHLRVACEIFAAIGADYDLRLARTAASTV
jgi:tetratricopeptide (TPR) repeat protein